MRGDCRVCGKPWTFEHTLCRPQSQQRGETYSVLTPTMVDAPPHYRQGAVECIDAIRAALTPEEFRGYCKGNVMKYIWREKMKGGDEDLKKAAAYLKFANANTAGPSSDAQGAGAPGAVEPTLK